MYGKYGQPPPDGGDIWGRLFVFFTLENFQAEIFKNMK